MEKVYLIKSEDSDAEVNYTQELIMAQYTFPTLRSLTSNLLIPFVLILFCSSFVKADNTNINEGFIHGYWFENSYSDITGMNSGTICNPTDMSITQDGFIGQAASFNHNGQGYIRLEDSYNTAFGIGSGKNGKMTILCWFNPIINNVSTDGESHVLISNSDWTNGINPGINFDASWKGGPFINFGDGSNRVDINASESSYHHEIGPHVVKLNQWQFVAITADFETNKAVLYYGTTDGTLQQFTRDWWNDGTLSLENISSFLSAYNWQIGHDIAEGDYFFGRIDEMGIWNRALTADDINAIYTAQKAGTSLASMLTFATSSISVQDGAYTNASTWDGNVVPQVDANVTINSAVTTDGRTFNGEAVITENGSLSATGCVFVGHSFGTNAKLTINGGNNVFSGNATNSLSSALVIGFQGGAGEFVLNNGTITVSGKTHVGYEAGGTATFTQTGGEYNSTQDIYVASTANTTASLNISNGVLSTTGTISIGTGADSTAQMNVTGGSVSAANFQIGHSGAGDSAKLVITNGVVEVTNAIYGSNGSNSGNIYISGTGQLVLNSTNSSAIRELTKLYVEGSGSDGTGVLRIMNSCGGNAAITLTNDTVIGIEPDKTFTQNAAITETKSSVLTITGGGTLSLSAQSNFTGGTVIKSSTVNLTSSGTLGTGSITLKEATLNLNGSVTSIPSDIIVLESGSITASSQNITQTGGSTTLVNGASLTINNGSNYTTQLNNLSGGTLDDNGQIADPAMLSVSGDLTLNNNIMTKFIGSITAKNITKTGDATLKLCTDAENKVRAESLVISSGELDFKGYFEGSVSVEAGAVLSPGNSVGAMYEDGNFTLNSNATLLMEIGGQTWEENDFLSIDGSLTIEDNAIIYIALADKYDFSSGKDFEAHIVAGTSDNDYTNSIFDSLVPGWPFYNLTVTKSGDNVYIIHGIYDPNAVPEPSTWALLILGVAGLLYVRKRVRS